MANTRSGTKTKEQAIAEQAELNTTNAKIAELMQMKSRVTNVKLKMSIFLRKMKMGLVNYRDLKDEVGEESERDATVIVIQNNWLKLEATANKLEETIAVLSDSFSKATAAELGEDPNTLIENQKREI